jgi:hypothetical protein
MFTLSGAGIINHHFIIEDQGELRLGKEKPFYRFHDIVGFSWRKLILLYAILFFPSGEHHQVVLVPRNTL